MLSSEFCKIFKNLTLGSTLSTKQSVRWQSFAQYSLNIPFLVVCDSTTLLSNCCHCLLGEKTKLIKVRFIILLPKHVNINRFFLIHSSIINFYFCNDVYIFRMHNISILQKFVLDHTATLATNSTPSGYITN